MTDATWIVLADSSRARIFRTDAELAQRPTVVEVLEHAAGRLREADLVSDGGNPGSGRGPRSSTAPPSARDVEIERFAQRVARYLGDARRRGQVDGIVLAAPPRFLGMLRQQMDKNTLDAVHFSVDKELTLLAEHQVLAAVRRHVA